MKNPLLLLTILLTTLTAQAAKRELPDIPPDAPSSMYRTHLGAKLLLSGNDGLDPIVKLGERNLDWLNFINTFRPAGEKLSLTSKDTQRGIPIDKPSEYNPTLIQKKLADLRPQMPEVMQKIIFENVEFTKEPPVAVVDYLNWSRELDRVYQSALRWRTMAPWLGYLAGNRHRDLRGWYFLSRMENRESKLKGFKDLEPAVQALLRTWLVNVCFNSDENDSIANCTSEVESLIAKGGDLETYYLSKAEVPADMFKNYFTIPEGAPRSEMYWQDGIFMAPFQDPMKEDQRSFLQVNIQDEWKFGDWHLELPFSSKGGLAHVEFVPGVTPHVNGLGGDTITMNANQPLTEYDAQWTIRHEYGHVLGFPDCYVEFYETERNVIVNYQFDIDNLMCSRRGHIQAQHVTELKRAYTN